jgi:hypothetical protein
VLDHPNRDRIVVGQSPMGPWIYASVPEYVPRTAGEPEADALARLRRAIDRSADKGTIVEFVQQRDPLARRGDVSPEQVRDRLRTFRATGLRSTSTVPFVHRRTRAAASSRSNATAMRCPRAARSDPNQSSIGVAMTGRLLRPVRQAKPRSSGAFANGGRPSRPSMQRCSRSARCPSTHPRRSPGLRTTRPRPHVRDRGIPSRHKSRSLTAAVTTGPRRPRASRRSRGEHATARRTGDDEDRRSVAPAHRR